MERSSCLSPRGFVVKYRKSVLKQTQTIEFLGLSINLGSMEIKVPTKKIAGIGVWEGRCSDSQRTQLPAISTFLMITAIHSFTELHRTQRTLPGTPHWDQMQMSLLANLTQKEELKWWVEQCHLWNGCFLLAPEEILKIQSEGSNKLHASVRTGGPWSLEEAHVYYHINYLELPPIFLAIRTFAAMNPDPDRHHSNDIRTQNRGNSFYPIGRPVERELE